MGNPGRHVILFPLRKFQLCENAVALGKLRVGLKYLTNRVLARTSTRKIPTRTFVTRNSHFTGDRPRQRCMAAALTSLCVLVKNRVRVRVSSRVRVRVRV